MKLTNTIRDAFIRAAMADVPIVDYQEQTIKLVMEDAIAQLPPKILAIYKNKELSQFIRKDGRWFGNAYVSVPCDGNNFKLSVSAAAKVDEIKSLDRAQDERNRDLKEKLRGVAYACKTRKELVEALPEFEKYLPETEAAACRTLPALTNVVSDFVKAGWPKGQKKPVQEVA